MDHFLADCTIYAQKSIHSANNRHYVHSVGRSCIQSSNQGQIVKWLLIYLVVDSLGVAVATHGTYSSMNECFRARDALKYEINGNWREQFPIGQQAVCIEFAQEQSLVF